MRVVSNNFNYLLNSTRYLSEITINAPPNFPKIVSGFLKASNYVQMLSKLSKYYSNPQTKLINLQTHLVTNNIINQY